MYGSVDAVMQALAQLADPISILLLVLGVALGLIIGILPGLGPPIAIALTLPFTYNMEPMQAIVLLLAIYSAAIYGGSITAIAVGIPGTGAAVATVQDGHAMYKKGRGGEALGLSLTGSVVGGLVSALILALLAPPLATFAAKFGQRELFAISLFGLLIVARVSGDVLWKGLLMGGLGLFLTTWGSDELTAADRFTFGSWDLYSGIALLPFLVGLFAVSEVLIGAERALKASKFDATSLTVNLPGLQTLNRLKGNLTRSSLLGTIIGIIPGEGAAVGAFLAYSEAKRASKNPDNFGKGDPDGIVAPETANNATVGGALVPTLTLGVPGSPAAAILLGAFLLHDITPGPKLFADRPDLMYSIFIGLFVINILMIFIGLLTIRFAAQLIRVPTSIIMPTVLLLSFVGIYAVTNSLFAVGVLLSAGILGYIIRKLGFPIAPLVIAFVLGGHLETSFRQSIAHADGSFTGFFTPISLVIYALLFLALFGEPIWKMISGGKKHA